MSTTVNNANDSVKRTVDHAAGAGTADKAEGNMTEAIGNAQQKIGQAVGSRELEARGVINEEDGKRQQAVGATKEAVSDTIHEVDHTAHNIGENIKDGVNRAVADVKDAFARK